jgi:prophage DNA circulation protein
MTLYELTEAYQKLQDYADAVAEDPALEAERQALIDSVDEQIDAKLTSIARVLRNYDAEIEALREEERRLAKKRRARENAAAWLKRYAKQQMEQAGKRKISDGVLTVALQKNPARLKLNIDEAMVPDEYLLPQPPKVDKRGIADALKSGEAIEWAELVQDESVRVR